MRRRAWRAAVLATGGMGLLLGGCALPGGVDGNLTDGWQSMPEPIVFTPVAGTCHADDYSTESRLEDYSPVDCAGEHVSEIVYVGQFEGGAAERVTPPETGTREWREAYQGCEEAAEGYLGADFRFARLWLGVVVPSTEAWEGGARWFRCDVLEFEDEIRFDFVRSGSLAGELVDEGSNLRLRCFEVTLAADDTIDDMDPVGCDEPHHAEFVGIFHAPAGGYLDGANESSARRVHSGCRREVAEYASLPIDADLAFRTGTIADWMDEEDWNNGDRGFRCYLWLNGDEINESLEGAGPDRLPIR